MASEIERLKSFRKENKLTQVQMAALLGIPQSYYSDIERGKKAIRFQHIKILAEKYNLDSDWLLVGSKEKEESQKTIQKLNQENIDYSNYIGQLKKQVELLNLLIAEYEKK